MEQANQTNVPDLATTLVRTDVMLAALACTSKDESRYYLHGVYLHQVNGMVRTVATDGHRMFIYARPKAEGEELPDWLDAGVIIPADGLKPRLALLDSVAHVAFATDAPHVVLSDLSKTCSFRMAPIDGTFPDYQRILDETKALEPRELGELSSTAYNSAYLKGVGDLAKTLGPKDGTKSVRIFGGGDELSPSLITFPDCPGAILILMPIRAAQTIDRASVSVLAVAINGTVSALKAHRTRWADKLATAKAKKHNHDEIDAKIAEYDARIAKVIADCFPVALPAPSGEATEAATDGATETPAELAEASQASPYAIAGAIEPESNVVGFPAGLPAADYAPVVH